MYAEQTLADLESAFLKAKADRFTARRKWEAAKGKYHLELIARREAGEKLTIADMKAMQDVAIDEVQYVKDAYLEFVSVTTRAIQAEVKFNEATREYWDNKEEEKRRLGGSLS